MRLILSAAVPQSIATRYPESDRSAAYGKEIRMSLIHESGEDTARDESMIDECIEELDGLVMSLDRYPPAAVAVAMSACLAGLLGALIDESLITTEEVRELLREIESGTLDEPMPLER
jgi:hypothetical protein